MDVFISYSTKDQEAAQGVMRMLEENHITYWICRSKIIAGDRWASEIVEALDSCKAVLLIVSKNSLASDQVPKEINFALEKQLPIIPYKIDNSPMKGELAYHLANIHRIQSEPFNNRYDELLEAISCKTGKKGAGGYVSASNSYNNITANVTNNISLNRISNFSIKWLLVIIAVIILLAAVIAGFNKDKDNDEAADSAVQGTVQQTVNEPLPDKSTDNTADASQPEQDKQENSGSAVFPDDIEPYQIIGQGNFYSIYKNELEKNFKMSGEEYSSGLVGAGSKDIQFLFNVSDKGYTTLSFKSGHVDNSDNARQYLIIYADDEEIYNKPVEYDAMSDTAKVDITGARQIKFLITAGDLGFGVTPQTGIADIVFYNSQEYAPEVKAQKETSSHEKAPAELKPYQTIGNVNFYGIYSNELEKSFKMCGEEYSSGLVGAGSEDIRFLFNVTDKGYTNLSFRSGHLDGSDNARQYLIIYADDEEIYRKTVEYDAMSDVSDIDISGAEQIKFEFTAGDLGFGLNPKIAVADIIFYNAAEYTPDGKAATAVSSHEKAPEDIMPYQTGSNINGYKIYNNSLNEDDFFTMAGNEYRSGFTADGQLDGMFLFNVSDKGYTNMSFLCGHIDGTDMLRQYVVVYGNGEEIFRKEIDPEALPEKVDVPIEGVGNIKLDFEYESDSIISRTSAGITELVFYNSSEYKP